MQRPAHANVQIYIFRSLDIKKFSSAVEKLENETTITVFETAGN
jgi:hypothetical protein